MTEVVNVARGARASGTHVLVEPVDLQARSAHGIRVPSAVAGVLFGRVASIGPQVAVGVDPSEADYAAFVAQDDEVTGRGAVDLVVGDVVCFLEKFSVVVAYTPVRLIALREERVIAVVDYDAVEEEDDE